ncbi:MAG: hypothetical protein ACKOB9_04850, partial [Solirubrobacterales bacterium]
MSGIEEWFERERRRGQDRERQCREKRAFTSEAEARPVGGGRAGAARQARQRRRRRAGGDQLE